MDAAWWRGGFSDLGGADFDREEDCCNLVDLEGDTALPTK